jgi:hypothetical protein
MTAMTFNAAPRSAMITTMLRGLFGRVADLLNAYAAHRMQHAVPDFMLRQADRDFKRCGRLMHTDAKRQAR